MSPSKQKNGELLNALGRSFASLLHILFDLSEVATDHGLDVYLSLCEQYRNKPLDGDRLDHAAKTVEVLLSLCGNNTNKVSPRFLCDLVMKSYGCYDQFIDIDEDDSILQRTIKSVFLALVDISRGAEKNGLRMFDAFAAAHAFCALQDDEWVKVTKVTYCLAALVNPTLLYTTGVNGGGVDLSEETALTFDTLEKRLQEKEKAVEKVTLEEEDLSPDHPFCESKVQNGDPLTSTNPSHEAEDQNVQEKPRPPPKPFHKPKVKSKFVKGIIKLEKFMIKIDHTVDGYYRKAKSFVKGIKLTPAGQKDTRVKAPYTPVRKIKKVKFADTVVIITYSPREVVDETKMDRVGRKYMEFKEWIRQIYTEFKEWIRHTEFKEWIRQI